MGPLWMLLAISVLAPSLLFGVVSWLNFREAFVAANQELLRNAEVAREHAARVFEGQSQITDRVNDLLRGMDSSAVIGAEKQLHDSLDLMIARLPQVQGVIVVDRDGRPLVSAAGYPVPRNLSLAEADYFKAVVERRESGPYVSGLQSGLFNKTPFFGLARAWRGEDGAVLGVINVAVPPAFFEDFYDSLIEEGGPDTLAGKLLMLMREDGTILARYPSVAYTPPHPRPTVFLASIRAHPDGGVYESPSAIEPGAPMRLFAYRKLAGFPLYVVAGHNRDSVVAGWRATVLSHLMFGVPATLALAAVTATALVRTRREQRALALANEEIGRRERAEAALLRSQRLEAVGQMTGGIAHDFNNLLTVILGSAELLANRADNPARVRQLSEQIVLATRRGGQITQQLLTFSRRQFLSPEVLDLNALLHEFEPLLGRAAGAAVTVGLDLQAGLHPVRLDPGHFEAAILNLVGNARDAISGDGRVLITTRNIELAEAASTDLPPGDYVRVSVTDTGQGMDAATAAKAFEPFFTTKGIGKGTGLGLSQVYGFAKQAGGEARIMTSPSHGATIELLLPRASEGLSPPEPPDPVVRQSTPAGELVVLVVEDDMDVRNIVVASVRELGYRALTASSADEALALLAGDGPIDLLFSDVMMPGGLNGLQLAEAAQRQRPGLRILLTSGYTGDFDQSAPAGVPLLSKPYNREQLLSHLQASFATG